MPTAGSAFLSIIFLIPFSAYSADPCPSGFQRGRALGNGLFEMTAADRGKDGKPTMGEIADPAPPIVNANGTVDIYGTGDSFVRYPSYDAFEQGGCFQVKPLTLQFKDPKGNLLPSDAPWDLRKFVVEKSGVPAGEFLVGGAMHPTGQNELPRWPADNVTRRVYRYVHPDAKSTAWVRTSDPVVGSPDTGWLGHSYGGNIMQPNSPSQEVIRADAKDPVLFFYEKVATVTDGNPAHTDIYMKQISGPGSDQAKEIPIFESAKGNYLSPKRTIGGTLSEGPRPIQVQIDGKTFFLIGFSSGDFCTDHYSTNFLWSKDAKGPYRPMLNDNKSDLKDYGADIKKQFGLSWVGRPALFKNPQGKYEMLFHGVFKKDIPDNDYAKWPSKHELQEFVRSIFKAPMKLELSKNGEPVLSMDLARSGQNSASGEEAPGVARAGVSAK